MKKVIYILFIIFSLLSILTCKKLEKEKESNDRIRLADEINVYGERIYGKLTYGDTDWYKFPGELGYYYHVYLYWISGDNLDLTCIFYQNIEGLEGRQLNSNGKKQGEHYPFDLIEPEIWGYSTCYVLVKGHDNSWNNRQTGEYAIAVVKRKVRK